MNSYGKSFYIANKAIFSSAKLDGSACVFDSIPALCPMHDCPLDLARYGEFAVIF